MPCIVIKAAASARLTSLQNVCLDLGLETGTAVDRRIDRFIDTVSGRISTLCNRAFGRQIYRERVRMGWRNGAVLSVGPVNGIVAVSYSSGQVLSEDQYDLSSDTLRLTSGSNGGIGDGSSYNLCRENDPGVIVDYEAGWVLPEEDVGQEFLGRISLPADIEQAAIQLVSVALSESGRDPTVRSENVQGVGSTSYSVQAAGAMLSHPGAEAALQPYRILSLV